jgi:hypothetical protein
MLGYDGTFPGGQFCCPQYHQTIPFTHYLNGYCDVSKKCSMHTAFGTLLLSLKTYVLRIVFDRI